MKSQNALCQVKKNVIEKCHRRLQDLAKYTSLIVNILLYSVLQNVHGLVYTWYKDVFWSIGSQVDPHNSCLHLQFYCISCQLSTIFTTFLIFMMGIYMYGPFLIFQTKIAKYTHTMGDNRKLDSNNFRFCFDSCKTNGESWGGGGGGVCVRIRTG